VSIAVIIVVTRYILKVIALFFSGITRGAITFAGFHRDWAEPTYKIVRFLVIVFAAIAIFPYIPGSQSEGFRGISVFLGLLISLGSAASIGNIVAGIVLTYMRPFQVGDRVQIADTTGDVMEKTLLVTRIRTIKNVDVTIPNAMVLGSHLSNYSSSSKDHGLILHTSVTIGYDAPWQEVHELLIAAARSTMHILAKPEPFVLQTSLNDFYVTYEINAYTDQPNLMATIYAELHQHIQDTFNEAGLEIMSPHYTQIRDGNKTAMPEQYLPKSYQAPGLRIDPLRSFFGKPKVESPRGESPS
jgi:small-conductance mechanosensitive channel